MNPSVLLLPEASVWRAKTEGQSGRWYWMNSVCTCGISSVRVFKQQQVVWPQISTVIPSHRPATFCLTATFTSVCKRWPCQWIHHLFTEWSLTHGSILCGDFQMSWKQTDVSAPGVCVLLLLKTLKPKNSCLFSIRLPECLSDLWRHGALAGLGY